MDAFSYWRRWRQTAILAAIDWSVKQGWVAGAKWLGRRLESHAFTAQHFHHWMATYWREPQMACTIELFYCAHMDVQKRVFETVSHCHRTPYLRPWATTVVEEYVFVSLLRWRHWDLLEEIIELYDPTFVTWVGLRFSRPEVYVRFYPRSRHDEVFHMLNHRVLEESEHQYWNAWFRVEERERANAVLEELQKNKLVQMVDMEDQPNKKRKI